MNSKQQFQPGSNINGLERTAIQMTFFGEGIVAFMSIPVCVCACAHFKYSYPK